MTAIVPKGTPLPTEQKQVFSTFEDNQSVVTVKVFQGEHSGAADNAISGEYNWEGIPLAPRGVPQIEVSFNVDIDENLSVIAKDLGAGRTISINSVL